MAGPNAPYTQLDSSQVLTQSFDETKDALRVDIGPGVSINISGQLEVAINNTEDSIALGTSTELFTSTTVGADVGLDVNIINPSIVVTATDLDIRDLDSSQDSIEVLQAIHDNLNANANIQVGNADVANGNPVPISDAGGSITVDGTVTSNQGTANTVTNGWPVKITDGVDTANVTAASELQVLSTAQPGVDIGDVTVNNAAGAAAVNIQDGGNSITVDGTVNAVQSGTWNINNISGTISLPTGASTLAEQQTQTTSLQLIDDIPHSQNAALNKGVPIMGQLDDTSTVVATEDNVSVARITAQRALHTNLRNNAGTEIATSANPLRTDPTGTTAQPVTDNGGSLTVDNTGTFAVQAAQSGSWSVSVNNAAGASAVNIQDGGNSITVDGTLTLSNIPATVDTNYGTVGANTPRSAAQIGNATGAANFNAGVTGAQTLRTASNLYDGSANAITSQTIGATQSLNVASQGNVASAATDSGNPVKTGGIVNLSGSLFTDAQRANTQMDISGSTYVNHTGRLPSYSAFSNFTTTGTATDIFTITGSATKTVKIRKITISGTNSGNTNALVIMLKRSTANTGGTSTTLTNVPHDSNNAAATATARSYTANPTTGSLVGNIQGRVIFLPLLGSSNAAGFEEMLYGTDGAQSIVLRGTSEVFAINLNNTAITGTTVMNISVDWTEE